MPSTKSIWFAGYKEVKNVIHNDIGITREEIIDIFKQIAREEIQDILSEKRNFIHTAIKEVIRNEMIDAVSDHRYPRVMGNVFHYGHNGRGENSFKDYISGIMQEEIVNVLSSKFEVKLNIDMKDNSGEDS